MATALSQRPWLLFAIGVVISTAYLAAVESMPADIRASLRAIPWVWLVPAIVCCALYALAWRNQPIATRAKYLRIAAYGLSAPVVAVLLVAVLYTWVVGANP
jgi:hypothetical protein